MTNAMTADEATRGVVDAIARAGICRACLDKRGSARTVLGPPGLREQIWNGWGVTVVLCAECCSAVEHAIGRHVYDANPGRYDALAARILAGDTKGLT